MRPILFSNFCLSLVVSDKLILYPSILLALRKNLTESFLDPDDWVGSGQERSRAHCPSADGAKFPWGLGVSRQGAPPKTPTVIVKRSVLAELGWFREDFASCEDWEMWVRLRLNNYFGCCPSPLSSIGLWRIAPAVVCSDTRTQFRKSARAPWKASAVGGDG